MRILGICGSLQAQSSNWELLRQAGELVPSGVELELFLGIGDLPHFNPDVEAGGVPEAVIQWRAALDASDALLIASPEYGFSLPGALKNAIDWVIGSGELEGKTVAITCSAPSAERGQRGLDALCIPLQAVSATILGRKPIVRGPNFQRELTNLLAELVRVLGDRSG